MRYINILTVGSNTHIPQSITAVCQLDILTLVKLFTSITDTQAATMFKSALCAGRKLATNRYRPSLLNIADLGSRKTFTLLTTLHVAGSISLTVPAN